MLLDSALPLEVATVCQMFLCPNLVEQQPLLKKVDLATAIHDLEHNPMLVYSEGNIIVFSGAYS